MFRKNKTEVLDWRAFFDGEIVTKGDALPPKPTGKKSAIALASAGVATALHSAKAPSEAITAMSPSFEQSISAATKPIKDIIFGFAGEIYFVFMAWGALEALIGKPQQGFARMKVATGAYILLYWVPWIVKQVNLVRPGL